MKWTKERRKEVLWIYDTAHARAGRADGPRVDEVTNALGDALDEIERLEWASSEDAEVMESDRLEIETLRARIAELEEERQAMRDGAKEES